MSGVEELSGENRALLEKHFGAFWGTIFYTSGPAMRTAINDLLNAARNQAPTPSVGTSRDWTPTPEAQTEAVVWLRNWCDRRFYKLIVHNTARLAIGALVEILAGRCDHSGDAQPIFAPSGEGLNRAQGHALTVSGEADMRRALVGAVTFEHRYREDNDRYPRDFWHVRASIGDLSTDWCSYGLQEHPVQIEAEKVEAENSALADLISSFHEVFAALAHPPQDHEQVSAQDGSAQIKRLRRKLDRWVALWGLLGADSFDGIEQRYREIGDHLANESKLEFGSALERGTAGGGEG